MPADLLGVEFVPAPKGGAKGMVEQVKTRQDQPCRASEY